MYRVKVEKVSGTYALAGGKWLRCIGNKNVNVGDYVFTDGRCVYGYDKESMSPIVINNPEKIGIPIRSDNEVFYYYNSLKPLGEINSNNDNFVNNKKLIQNINQLEKGRVLSANIDTKGNIYLILWSYSENSVEIIKNGIVEKKISLKKFNEEVEGLINIPLLPYRNTPKGSSEVYWGFIENENNWAFIVMSRAECAEIDLAIYGALIQIGNILIPWRPDLYQGTAEDYASSSIQEMNFTPAYRCAYGRLTYVDSSEKSITLLSYDGEVANDDTYYWSGLVYHDDDPVPAWWLSPIRNGVEYWLTKNFSANGLESVKFPIHDGYYFTMHDPVLPLQDTIGLPCYIKKTVYTPEDKIIFSNYTRLNNNFICSKTNSGNYLLYINNSFDYSGAWGYLEPYNFRSSTDNLFHPNISPDEMDTIMQEADDNIKSLWIIDKHGTKNKLLSEINNFNLRPTLEKKIRRWLRLQQERSENDT